MVLIVERRDLPPLPPLAPVPDPGPRSTDD